MGLTRVPLSLLAPDARQPLPLSVRGDLPGFDGSAPARIPVGSDGQVLAADSNASRGVSWTSPVGAIVGELRAFAFLNPPIGWLLCDGTVLPVSAHPALAAAIGFTFGGNGTTTFALPNLCGRALIGSGSQVTPVAVTQVDPGTDQLTVDTNEILQTGARVYYNVTGTAAGGLQNLQIYYVIRVSSTIVQLATSLANAVSGTAINITSASSAPQNLAVILTPRALGEVVGEEKHALTIAEVPAHAHAVIPANGSVGTTVSGVVTFACTGVGLAAVSAPTGGSGAHNNMQPSLIATVCIYAGV